MRWSERAEGAARKLPAANGELVDPLPELRAKLFAYGNR
jgi:hypothetical protein